MVLVVAENYKVQFFWGSHDSALLLFLFLMNQPRPPRNFPLALPRLHCSFDAVRYHSDKMPISQANLRRYILNNTIRQARSFARSFVTTAHLRRFTFVPLSCLTVATDERSQG